jgi:hypothetical protein
LSEMPADIVDCLKQIVAVLGAPGHNFPDWFIKLEQGPRRSHGWVTLFENAIAEIERARAGGGEELEQMKKLAGRLMRRLTDGSDIPHIERWLEENRDL